MYCRTIRYKSRIRELKVAGSTKVKQLENLHSFHDTFLQLVRLGIGTSKDAKFSKDFDWAELKALADVQGLTAVVLDGLDILNTNGSNSTNILPLQQKLEWIGEVLQNYEQRYVQYENAIGSLAGFYNQYGFKMMVLKGFACSLDWPKPNHRPCGDIDLWLFNQQKTADAAMTRNTDVRIDGSRHHHTVFNWKGFTVENHYDFVNVHSHKSSAEIESFFKKMGKDDSHYIKVNGEIIYLPSANMHALFLLRHAMVHFTSSGISLRNILDWAFHVKAHYKEIDWSWLEDVLERFGMKHLYGIFNAICVEDLGFEAKYFHGGNNLSLKNKVLDEILFPAIPNDKPKELFSRIVWKIRRWKASGWKRKLVYNESMYSAFWSGIWCHLLKLRSI